MDILDTTKIKTAKDINNIDFDKYADSIYKRWLVHIQDPISQAELTRLYLLSKSRESNFLLNNSQGELYYTPK